MNLSVQQEGGSNVSFLSLIKASNITLVFPVVLRVKSARLNLIDGISALMIQNTLKPVSLVSIYTILPFKLSHFSCSQMPIDGRLPTYGSTAN